MRDWADEKFRKLYTRDNADLAAMPYQAKSLLWHLLRVMDDAGLLDLGRNGLASLPIIFRAEDGNDPQLIRTAAEYLLKKDGCLRLVERQGRLWLFWPNFPPAQAAAASDRARQQAKRERDAALARAKSMGLDEAAAFLDGGEQATLPLGDRAEGAGSSRHVTGSHDQKRLDQIRLEEEEEAGINPEDVDDLPVVPVDGSEAQAEFDPGDLFQRLWNEITKPPIPRWPRMTAPRRKAAKARWREEPREGYWRAVLERIQASPFCRGENDRNWKATPGWFLKPESHVRTMEGMYDARGSGGGGQSQLAKDGGPQLRVLTAQNRGKLYG